MATFKFTIKNKPNANGEHSIIIQIIKDRKNTSLSLGKSCKYEDWSFETDRVKKTNKKHSSINEFIAKYSTNIEKAIEEYDLNDEYYTSQDLIKLIKKGFNKSATITFTEFHEALIEEKKLIGKLSSAKIEQNTLDSLKLFFKNNIISFKDINVDNLHKYNTFLTANGNKPSTIGIRMRTLRAVYNKAIEREIVNEKSYPFTKFKISKIKCTDKKEYLTEEEILKIKDLELSDPKLIKARDFFLMSFYCRGINMIDLIQLKKSDLSNYTTTYIRSKTGAIVNFKSTDFFNYFFEKYKAETNSIYLFNFIKTNTPTKQYIRNINQKYLQHYINVPLVKIMETAEINKHITYYCARHSFATILKFKNISIDIIKEALGHKDIQSTMSYLNTLPSQKLDMMIEDAIDF
ncbi:site-specific integrase [Empedobacter stercoris]|uniref:site-specific integrase n=1 Tax=Empedobacter stercoris TaxID=1628248 RepID=UPI0016626663|nr:site-specific integrase [Empedobacter stercoris]MCA4809613.1 site-specific integrase [Empedobacter stercoris]QNT13536.1 tyrosine-type recombinase/integrase [Empedobacter stercoris]